MRFGLSLAIMLVLSHFAWAESPTPSLKDQLLHSAWEGTFTPVKGASSPIRLVFLPELTAKGELQYFHRLTGAVASEVLTPDEACKLTPRALSVAPVAGSAGKISVFACVNDPEREDLLEHNRSRRSRATINVSEIKLSPDGNSLDIVARAAKIPLKYHLQKKPMPTETPSRQELRSWLDAPAQANETDKHTNAVPAVR